MSNVSSAGIVSLVGAGPGHPGLLTVKARRSIERADLVLYDHLASVAVLQSIRVPAQERIHVGKTAGMSNTSQEAINELMIRRARAGKRVVRLKGGDPYVFGRGGEEAESCISAGVPFEVIPGVSSVTAVLAYAGIPLTTRGLASAVTIAAGHEAEESGRPSVDWAQLANASDTIVVLMGVGNVGRWSTGLQAGGLSAQTPVAIVQWGTLPRQRSLITTLGQAATAMENAGIGPPAVVVVGKVVNRRETLGGVESLPLFGQVIGVSRSNPGDLHLFERLEDRGAFVLHIPLTRQEPVTGSETLEHLVESLEQTGITDLVFTSANGVRYFAAALDRSGRDARALHGIETWCVGPSTALAMKRHLSLKADRVPKKSSADGLVELAKSVGVDGKIFLFPAAKRARKVMPEGLRALGATVHQAPCYDTVAEPLAPALLESALEQGLSTITVASPSAVDALIAAMEAVCCPLDRLMVAAIGPTTANHGKQRGLRVEVISKGKDMAGLVDAILEHLG